MLMGSTRRKCRRASRAKSGLRMVCLIAGIMAVVAPRLSAEIILVDRLSDARASALVSFLPPQFPPPQEQTDFLPAHLSNSASVSGEPGAASAQSSSNSSIEVDNSLGTLRVPGDGTVTANACVIGSSAQASAKEIGLTFTLTDHSYTYSMTGQLGDSFGGTATAKLTAGSSTIFQVITSSAVTLSEAGTLPPGTYKLSVDTTASANPASTGGPCMFRGNGANFNFALDLAPTPTPTATATATPAPTATPFPDPCYRFYLNERFDSVTAPGLPPGWTTSFSTGAANCTPAGTCAFGSGWVTSTNNPASAPNCAFHDAPGCVTDSNLDTTLHFDGPAGHSSGTYSGFTHRYDLQNGFDGAVLEISIAGGPFTDFVAAGGVFTAGGYNGTISTDSLSPIAGRPAWTGNSGGYVGVNFDWPEAAVGQNVTLRFRLATDCAGSGVGWRIDEIFSVYLVPCPSPTPPPPPTPTPGTPTPTPGTPTPTPATPTPSPATPTPTPPGPPTPTPTSTPGQVTQAVNLSTRLLVGTGDSVGIGGFIITGSDPKQVLLRGIGPSLAGAGIANPLPDPVLELHGPGAFVTITNNNWREVQEAAIIATGIPPTNNLESAILVTLDPGAYTAILRGNGGTSGVALVEVYGLGASASKLANISTRAFVSTGNDIVIAGFILSGGSRDNRIILRGLGPSLEASGLSPVLANPTLELRDSNGALLISNNDWQETPIEPPVLGTGLEPGNPLESATGGTLPPGAYTALLSGVNGGTGLGLVEVYDLGSQ
jgi:hypothetical protein